MHNYGMTEQEHVTADAITETVLMEMGYAPKTDLKWGDVAKFGQNVIAPVRN